MSSDEKPFQYSDSLSSLAFHRTNPHLLLAGCWDRNVYLHNLAHPAVETKLAARGSILDVAWGESESVAFVGGTDSEVRSIDFNSSQTTLLSTHNAPVKCVEWSTELNVVLSASWDKTLHLTSLQSLDSTVLSLPEKVYGVSMSKSKIVVAMGSRAIWIYDVRMLSDALEKRVEGSSNGKEIETWQRRESSLKFMTRAVKCMPNDQGYVTTSIEGRVAVEFFDENEQVQAKKYAFKCHRQTIDGVDHVYPVSGLAFNPIHGTFATGGGDATVSLWDPFAKKRLRQFPKYSSPISALEFNCDGTKLAIAMSEDDDYLGGAKTGNSVSIREVFDDSKPKKV